MNLDKQISEFSDLLIKNGFDGVVQVTERRNYNTSTDKIKGALEALKLSSIDTSLSIRTYFIWKNDSNYTECYFDCKYTKDDGFLIKNLAVEVNKHGHKRNFNINLPIDQNLPATMINNKIMLIAQIKLIVDKRPRIKNKLRF